MMNKSSEFIKPFYIDIENAVNTNDKYRNVLYTSNNLQFVLMNLKPNDFIHMEVHKDHDQFIKIESGKGIAIITNQEYTLSDGIGIIIPAGTQHKIINTSQDIELKLYTIYSPPEHTDQLVQVDNPDLINESLNNFEIKFKNKYLKYKNKYLKYKNLL